MYIKNRLGLIEGVETMLAQEHRMNQIANNLANVDTAGFKKENVTFWEMLFTAQDKQQRIGKAMKLINDHAQGSEKLTESPTDFAIGGAGFFRIQTDRGTRYTRNGNFHIDNAGQLVTGDGDSVLGQGGPITLGSSSASIAVTPAGDILIDGQAADNLGIVTFSDLQALKKEGNNLYAVPAGVALEEIPAEQATVQQGSLEMSNVSVTREMTEMIDLQRAYESQQKIIFGVDELDGVAISRVGRLE